MEHNQKNTYSSEEKKKKSRVFKKLCNLLFYAIVIIATLGLFLLVKTDLDSKTPNSSDGLELTPHPTVMRPSVTVSPDSAEATITPDSTATLEAELTVFQVATVTPALEPTMTVAPTKAPTTAPTPSPEATMTLAPTPSPTVESIVVTPTPRVTNTPLIMLITVPPYRP